MTPAPAWTGPRSSTAEVLKVLSASPGEMVPYAKIVAAAWPGRDSSTRRMRVSLRVAVFSLRNRGHVIENIMNHGYRYVPLAPQKAGEAPCA